MSTKLLLASTTLMLLLSIVSPLAAQDMVDYHLRWQPNADEYRITHYVLYRSPTTNDQDFVVIATIPAGTHSYTDTGLQLGSIYYYRLVARDDNSGEESAPSLLISGLSIPENASETMKNLCRIVSIDSVSGGYDINWSTAASTIGFIQYGTDISNLTEMSDFVTDQYSVNHTVTLSDLFGPETYYLRAVSYDANNNMIISAIDTLEITHEPAAPITTPQMHIYPVPYHPNMGNMTLSNPPTGGSVYVYSANGLEVWQRNIGSETSIEWDGLNRYGSPVSSGAYYVIAKDASGNVVEKRPIMIVN